MGKGGGGGASPGALGIGGAGGMTAGGGLRGESMAGESGAEPFDSTLARGLGGPIVPNRIDASCLAPPPGRSSSSSESSAEDSIFDHSSSSGRARIRGALTVLAMFSRVSRWNGLVDTAASVGGVGTAGVDVVPFA